MKNLIIYKFILMIPLIILGAFSNYYLGPTENKIINTCKFDILRISRRNVTCIDYGKYVHYCHHFSQPIEFKVLRENGLFGKQISIYPVALWEDSNYNKELVAKYVYSFTCDSSDNNPKLIQHIIPNSKFDVNPLFSLILILTLLLIVICWVSLCGTSNSNRNNNLTWYMLGSHTQSHRRVYSE